MERLVSIIIPCYNQGEYLQECIDSIDRQTYKEYEIIIINDGSTEIATLDFLRKIERDRKDIKLINQNNSGVSSARNKGIENSNGHYILPLDGDDMIAETYIEKCVKVLDENTGIDIVYCIGMCFGFKKGLFVLNDFAVKKMLKENLVFCSAMYRRSDFDQTTGYNCNMIYGYEDWDFWLSMIEIEKNFFRINEVLFYYRIKEISRNSQTSFENKDKRLRMIHQIIENHQELYRKYKIGEKDFDYKYKFSLTLFLTGVYSKTRYVMQKLKLLYLAKF
ncbi:glycosyltransferase family 2 protein [Paenibacillus sp. HW567]|uniref:glycosyltransferase family 2 protein n=1 Tax=Paenibacillus sp. HW567 TaxID=1034769 RepID=UPI0003695EC1|nr:glycosyltransferase family A protein [Paenibacillus sp. HW567]